LSVAQHIWSVDRVELSAEHGHLPYSLSKVIQFLVIHPHDQLCLGIPSAQTRPQGDWTGPRPRACQESSIPLGPCFPPLGTLHWNKIADGNCLLSWPQVLGAASPEALIRRHTKYAPSCLDTSFAPLPSGLDSDPLEPHPQVQVRLKTATGKALPRGLNS
jgi:hypothetical protein